MARLARVIGLDLPHHVTQRGNGRRFILDNDTHRSIYLDLLAQSLELHGVLLVGYCLMSNHVHLVLIPRKPESMGLALKHAHGRFASSGTPLIEPVVMFGRDGTTLARWMRRIFGRRCATRN
jgi:putative transposase